MAAVAILPWLLLCVRHRKKVVMHMLARSGRLEARTAVEALHVGLN